MGRSGRAGDNQHNAPNSPLTGPYRALQGLTVPYGCSRALQGLTGALGPYRALRVLWVGRSPAAPPTVDSSMAVGCLFRPTYYMSYVCHYYECNNKYTALK